MPTSPLSCSPFLQRQGYEGAPNHRLGLAGALWTHICCLCLHEGTFLGKLLLVSAAAKRVLHSCLGCHLGLPCLQPWAAAVHL